MMSIFTCSHQTRQRRAFAALLQGDAGYVAVADNRRRRRAGQRGVSRSAIIQTARTRASKQIALSSVIMTSALPQAQNRG